MGYHVAVVGATGNVGREILKILSERQFPLDKLSVVSSRQSVGKAVSFGDDETLKCQALEHFDFKGVDIVLSSAGSKVAKEFAPRAASAGAVTIDNSSAFRMEPDVPLVVPEVNLRDLKNYKKRMIIGSPNCVAIPLAVALKPLHDMATVKRVILSTYQSTSGAGRHAMNELDRQTRDVYLNNPLVKEYFTKQIAFNVIPHIDQFLANGQTGEEEKIANETRKILGHPAKIFATTVRVPTFIGHAISCTVEFEKPLSDSQARDVLKKAKGVKVVDTRQDEGYATPLDVAQEDDVFVSRIRKDPTVENGLGLWIVSDNLRKGAALNTVQVAESLIENYLS